MPSMFRAATAADVDAGVVSAAVDSSDGSADLVMATGSGKYVVGACMLLEHVMGLAVGLIATLVPAESAELRAAKRAFFVEQQTAARLARLNHVNSQQKQS